MTTPSRFRRIEELFHELVDLDESERRAILDPLAESDLALHDEIEDLLARDAGAAVPSGASEFEADAPDVGDRVGPFRLVRLLGEGGMGRVFEAEQDEPVHRRVALKLIQPRLWGPVARARFARERRALASLSHPGIAHVLEAGSTGDGMPWVALELVEGSPITEYCDRHRLTVDDRLRLMAAVLRAVHHAHQRSILHRDLKPSNLLVAERDGIALPKVIDFGIAKALDEEAGEAAARTRIGELVGTLEYMSPEQTLGARLDTRSDVYSLGVVLYELVTGATPHRGSEPGGVAAGEELRRRIREEEPRRPSAAVSGAGGAHVASVARERSTDPRALRHRLAGELEWILLAALAKDPERRYESAAAFAVDLEANLAHRPVAAGPPSPLYRMRKLLRRHRLGVTATTTVAVALVAATLVSSRLYLRAEDARRRAETERLKATAVSEFLAATLARADPVVAQSHEEVSLRSVLDEAAWQIPSALGDQPEVAATLDRTIGGAYRNLGLLERSAELLRRALARSTPSRDPEGRLATLLALAETELELDRRDEAEALAREALETSTAPAWAARSRRILALVERERGEHERAETSLRDALADARSAGDAVLAARVRRDLGLLLADRGRFDEAITELEAVLAERRAALGDHHSEVAESMGDLAWVLISTQQQERGLELSRGALGILERVYPPGHPQVAIARSGLGNLLRELGRPAEALREHQQVLADFRAALGERHIFVAHELNNLALALEQVGETSSAVELYRDVVARYLESYGADHPTVAIARSNLAHALRSAGDRIDAESEILESLRIRRAALGADHPDVARSLFLLAQLRLDRGDAAAALPLLEQTLAIRRARLPAVHALTAATLLLLGSSERDLGRGAATGHLDDAVEMYRALESGSPGIFADELDRARAARAGETPHR